MKNTQFVVAVLVLSNLALAACKKSTSDGGENVHEVTCLGGACTFTLPKTFKKLPTPDNSDIDVAFLDETTTGVSAVTLAKRETGGYMSIRGLIEATRAQDDTSTLEACEPIEAAGQTGMACNFLEEGSSLIEKIMIFDTPARFVLLGVTGTNEARREQVARELLETLTLPAPNPDRPPPWRDLAVPQPADTSLLEDRAAHDLALIGPETPWERYAAPQIDGMRRVRYPSPAGKLAAYVTPDPGDGEKHPAVLWAHGGFGGIDGFLFEEAPPENDQSVRVYADAGLVVMTPSWRGENDNPGRFELFYGEVEDLLAAAEYLAGLPYVDPERIYLAGHATGGTLALLAATASDRFRAVFSFGGAPDMVDLHSDGEGYGNTPYDISRQREHALRSATRYVGYMERPTFYFEGENSLYCAPALMMEYVARKQDAPFEVHIVDLAGPYEILRPLAELIVEKIAADTGETTNIAFSDAEIRGVSDALAEQRAAGSGAEDE